MQAVADAEHRDATGPEARVRMGRAVFVDTGGTARQDHSDGLAGGDLRPWRVERQELRVDIELPYAAGDQPAVLTSEVENADGIHVRAARHHACRSEENTYELQA